MEAIMYIRGLIEKLPRRAPAVAIRMLRVINFFAPNLSENNPVGTEKKNWQRDGIATMRPIKKTKPIKKSKPLTSLDAEGKPLGIEKPKIAGYLPPKPKTDAEKDSETPTANPPATDDSQNKTT